MGHSSLKKEDNVFVNGEGHGYTMPPHMTHTTILQIRVHPPHMTHTTMLQISLTPRDVVPPFLYILVQLTARFVMLLCQKGRQIGKTDDCLKFNGFGQYSNLSKTQSDKQPHPTGDKHFHS